jgi:hypothetical protein
VASTDSEVLEQPFVLPADATLTPLAELSPRVRATLGPIEGGDEQVAVSRPRFRVPTRLITPEFAALLGEFREPSRIADAVLRFSRARERDPFETLEDAFDALALFINCRVLVPADSPTADGVVATLASGQGVAGYEVERLVSALDDTEVYLARTGARTPVALKIARPGAPEAVAAGLAGEARILEHLGGGSSPALVEHGSHRDRPFVAQEWRPGPPVSVAAQQVRAGAHSRRRLHALGRDLLSAYAWIHDRGVVHGDIHPGNVIVGDDGAVTILDFGRSHLLTSATPDADPARAGMAWFYEPEMASALRAGAFPPPATKLGEQYSLAALLYYVITGLHYAELSPEHDLLLAQVVDRPPLPFTARGLEPWPAVEAVLATALAKDPAERFPSVGHLRDAFDQAGRERRRAPAERFAPADAAARLVADHVARAGRTSARSSGTALDLAWFTYRTALARGDADLLASADVWASRAAANGAPDWALAAVTAAIHRARGDAAAQSASAIAFESAWEGAGGGLDLLGGRSGALAAAARVLEGMVGTDADSAPLARLVRQTIEETWRTVDAWGPVADCPELPHLGMAHGWAGLLYATLRACRSTATPHPGGVGERLDQLADLAEPSGRGVRWAGTIPHAGNAARTPTLAPGWCSGSAGHAVLWVLAHDEIGDRRYLDLAERAALYAIDHPAGDPDLCCGTTGRGFALLHLYQATGEERWRYEAERLALSAAAAWPEAGPIGLRRGPLGTALLLVELEVPECAVLPMFGPREIEPA